MSGAYHASVNVICFESCVLYRSGVILCCVRGGFPCRFMGRGVVCEVDCKVSHWLTYFAADKKDSCLLPAWARKRRNWY